MFPLIIAETLLFIFIFIIQMSIFVPVEKV